MKKKILLILYMMYMVSLHAQVINPFFWSYPSWSQELEEKAQTNPHAQVVVGCYYLNGDGVEKDYGKAVYWLKKSLTDDNQDIGRAYNNLGYCHEHGLGVPQNMEQAFSYYYKAAHNNDNASYVNLAECYEQGKGTQVNLDSALVWYQKGIEWGTKGGERKSKVRCGYIFAFEKNDAEKGIEYFEKAIKDGSGAALYYMGIIYDLGIGGLTKDPEKAVYYYKESIDTETYPFVITELANHYYEGNGVTKDIEKAIELYKDAARMGDETAKEKLKEIGR